MIILRIVPFGIIDLIRFDSNMFRQGIEIFVYMRWTILIVYKIFTQKKNDETKRSYSKNNMYINYQKLYIYTRYLFLSLFSHQDF
jgi:hypothetical protein